MSLFYLVRHATTAMIGKAIAGRLPGVPITDHGRVEARNLAKALSREKIDFVISSPLERARQTAEPIAAALGLELGFSEDLIEIDFGDWNGKSLEALETDSLWRQWNSFRSGVRAPNGGTILEAQLRFVSQMQRLHRLHPEAAIVLVSHADPIKAALAHWLGFSLDSLLKIDIEPASLSMVELNEWGARVRAVNIVPGRFTL